MTQNGVQRGGPTARPMGWTPGELILSSLRAGDVHTIALRGELDLATAARIEQELKRVEATDAASIVIDLSGLSFMDSTGIRILIEANVRSRAGSERLALRRGSAAVRRVVELSGVGDMLPFVD